MLYEVITLKMVLRSYQLLRNGQTLDLGFEFYAPQTTQAADGRRLMFGWMGLPDEQEASQPTIAHGWIHTMTCPRELTLKEGKLYQLPVAELSALRRDALAWQGIASQAPALPARSAELILKADGPFSLNRNNFV